MMPEVTIKVPRNDLDLRLFISYSHKDRGFVHRLVHDLRAEGIPVLVDEDEVQPGDSIRRRLEEVIESTDVFLIIISPDSLQSSWVQEEMDLILERTIQEGAISIPLIVREAKLPGFLRGRRAIDFAEYERGLDELLISLRGWDRRKRDRLLAAKARAIELDPGDSPMATSRKYAEVGALAISIGRYGEAIANLRRSVEINKRNWDARFLLSVALIKAGRYAEADAILREALESRVQMARAHYNLACSYSRQAEAELRSQGQWEQKLELCLENLRQSISLGFVTWLRQHASRSNPVGDILGDPDLGFARGRRAEVEQLLQLLCNKYGHFTERLVYGGGGGGGGSCIVGNMRVSKLDGSTVPIESIRPGHYILSEEKGNQPGCARVWRKMRFWAAEGVVLNGRLAVTVSQPLYREGRWVPAGSLKVGDAIGGPGGAEIPITRIERWNKPTPVYQLSLEGAPVFVAEDALVHNAKIH